MENVNCKKFLLGAFLVAFGSAQTVASNFPQYSQGPTNAYVDLSLPESAVLGGQALVGGQIPVQENYQGGRNFESMPSSIGGNGVTVLDSRSEIVRGEGQSYGSQLSQQVNGYGYQTSNEYRNLDPRVAQEQVVQQQAPVVQDAQQYGRPEVYGQQYASTLVPEQAQPYVYTGAANINTGDQTGVLYAEAAQAARLRRQRP